MTLARGMIGQGFGCYDIDASAISATVVDNEDGTATVTLSGSETGAENEVYVRRWGLSLLSSAWSLAGSRTGDGDVEIDVAPGLYWLYVLSAANGSSAATSPFGFRATDGEDALHYQCAEAVVDSILALSLSDDYTEDTVRAMELPWSAFREIGAKGIIVTPIREELESENNQEDDIAYRVQVSFLESSQQNLVLDKAPLLVRERVVRAFSEIKLPGDIPGHYFVEVVPGPVVVPEAVTAEYRVGAIMLHCHCRVDRGVR